MENLEPRMVLSAETAILPGVGPEYTVYVQEAEYLPIQLDPGDRLVNTEVGGTGVPVVLGEWSTNNQLEGWTVNNAASSSVTGGSLTATLSTSTNNDLRVQLLNINPEPNLDFGFNDYVQVRMKLPEGYDEDITFFYGTTTRNGFSDDRQFVLPGEAIPDDGQWHEYRFDVGLEVFWRDQLDDLRIVIPDTGVAGQTVEIDYVEVGDRPGDVLLVNDNVNLGGTTGDEVVAAGDLTRIESKHFAVWWSPTVDPEFNPATNGRNALRMNEEAYQVYSKILGYIEPFYAPGSQEAAAAEKSVTLDWLNQMQTNTTLPSLTFSKPFTVDGAPLDFVVTFDATDQNGNASLHNNGQGIQPVPNGFVGSGGDKNTWENNEDILMSYQILDDGVDVTADYEVAVTGVTARWRNDPDPTITLTFGADQSPPFGELEFEGFPGPGRIVDFVEADEPIDITAGAGGFVLDVLQPSQPDRFNLQDIELAIDVVGGGGDGGPAPGPAPPPSAIPDLSLDRFKSNHITWYSGFFMGAQDGFTYQNVGEGGLRDEGTGNPVPHELGHVFQGAQPAFLLGGHWESHANYVRENWTNYFAPLFPEDRASNLSIRPFINSNFRQDHKRFIYQDYRTHLAIQDFATDFGLDPNAAAQLWQVGEENQGLYEKLDLLLPDGVTVADVLGESLRRWPVLDFLNAEQMRANLWTTDREEALFNYRIGSLLVPSADDPDLYRVPFERAPEKYGYMVHELTPTDSSITVDFRGLDVIGDDEDWRWSLVAVNGDKEPRYSDVWSQGEHTFDLLPGEDRVLLVVVATPDDITLDLDSYYNTKQTDKQIDRLRYPYEVRITGAEQASKQLGWDSSAGSFHTNPDGTVGGWVANTATVAPTAYVGPNAKVLDTAQVLNNARIEDYAVVADNARVRDNAVISGFAAVLGTARVEDNARMRDRAVAEQTSNVLGNAVVEDYARLRQNMTLSGNAIARGSTEAFFNTSVVSGTAILDADYSMGHTVDNGVHQNHIAFGGWFEEFYADTQTKPRGLIASYRVEAPEGEALWDEFGAQHAWLQNGPQRVNDLEAQGAVLEFNGEDQHVLLDRSVFDVRDGGFGMWVKPETTDAGQTLMYAGSSASSFLQLSSSNGTGAPVMTIFADGEASQIVSSSTLEAGEWSHVAVTFGDGQMLMYVNGVLAGVSATSLTPSDVLGPNTYEQGEHLYVGRSSAGGYFEGRMDDIRFYNVTQTPDEVVSEQNRRGAVLGTMFTGTPTDFNGASDRAESGVRNGLARTLSASINPDTSPSTSYYQAIFDSNSERDNGNDGSGFGLNNGQLIVKLDGQANWNTGVQIPNGVWTDITLAFNGTQALLYVNGEQVGERSYNANPDNLAGKNYRIGFGQADNDSFTYFDGQIQDVVILDNFFPPDAALGGDYNQDGIVTAADYTLWRGTLGDIVEPGSGADGSGNGVIDIADYQLWKDNFGELSLPPSTAELALGSSTPEPVTTLPQFADFDSTDTYWEPGSDSNGIGSADYNLDGVVNASDYAVWRNTLGDVVVPGTGADGSGNGVIDIDDYRLWQANFGQSSFDSALLPETTTAPAAAVASTPIDDALAEEVDLMGSMPLLPPTEETGTPEELAFASTGFVEEADADLDPLLAALAEARLLEDEAERAPGELVGVTTEAEGTTAEATLGPEVRSGLRSSFRG